MSCHEGIWGSGGAAPCFFLPNRWLKMISQLHLQLNTLGKVPPRASPSNQYVWGWVDPRTSLDSVAKRKVL